MQLYEKDLPEDSGSDCQTGDSGRRSLSFDELYEEVALNCFRYLDYKSLDEVDRLTIREYDLLMKAVQLKKVDREYWVHNMAFQNLRVRGRKGKGKNARMAFRNFKQFFDYSSLIDEVLHGKKKADSVLGKFLKNKERS